jgi:soluble P-type ATPase
MKFSALALDYDGTIATDGRFSPAVRQAIGEVREHGVAVILVTGRRIDDLRRVAGDLSWFRRRRRRKRRGPRVPGQRPSRRHRAPGES